MSSTAGLGELSGPALTQRQAEGCQRSRSSAGSRKTCASANGPKGLRALLEAWACAAQAGCVNGRWGAFAPWRG